MPVFYSQALHWNTLLHTVLWTRSTSFQPQGQRNKNVAIHWHSNDKVSLLVALCKGRHAIPSASIPKCILSAKVRLMTDFISRHWSVFSGERGASCTLPQQQIPSVGKAVPGHLLFPCSQWTNEGPGPHEPYIREVSCLGMRSKDKSHLLFYFIPF